MKQRKCSESCKRPFELGNVLEKEQNVSHSFQAAIKVYTLTVILHG